MRPSTMWIAVSGPAIGRTLVIVRSFDMMFNAVLG
jgi:hypothetical protein